jgi:hypothetical protein
VEERLSYDLSVLNAEDLQSGMKDYVRWVRAGVAVSKASIPQISQTLRFFCRTEEPLLKSYK